MRQTSRDKNDRLQRTTAESTTSVLDGYGLRCHWPASPAPYASYPVLVHRLAFLLHASFRPRLATTPLRFAITSPPSGCEGDLHPQAVIHARRTEKGSLPGGRLPLTKMRRLCGLGLLRGFRLRFRNGFRWGLLGEPRFLLGGELMLHLEADGIGVHLVRLGCGLEHLSAVRL